jgi:hypothetical protein
MTFGSGNRPGYERDWTTLDYLEESTDALGVSFTDNEISNLEESIDPAWSPKDFS